MWFVRFYDGMLQATLRFLLGLNNTVYGFIILLLVMICYLKDIHDAAIFFGGVATTLLGIKGAEHINTTYAPNASAVNNQPTNIKEDTSDAKAENS